MYQDTYWLNQALDQILRADMISAIANKIDDVAFEGGASNEPTGILGGSAKRYRNWN